MIPLQITTDNPTSLRPDPTLAPFYHWRDPEGAVIACGYTAAGCHWLEFPGLATYRFGDAAGVVRALPEAGAPPAQVHDIYLRAVLPLVLHTRGRETLHASAVLARAGVVAFCARSETGKSTLAYALARRGYPPFGDDALVLRRAGDDWSAVPYPFHFRLRPPTAAHFAVDGSQRPLPADGHLPATGEPQPLAALFLLTRLPPAEAAEPVAVRPLSPAAALPLLLNHAYAFNLEDPARNRRMAEAYLDLATAVPVYDLRYAGTLDALPDVLAGIEAILLQPAPPPARK